MWPFDYELIPYEVVNVKKTEIDRAIEDLEGQKRAIDLAIETLKQQQSARATRKRRTPKPVVDISARQG